MTRPDSAAKSSLAVAWSAPETAGKPALSDYDVRYRVQGSAGWSAAVHEGIATTTILRNLIADTVYEVQVLASNAEGSSDWSAGGTGEDGGGHEHRAGTGVRRGQRGNAAGGGELGRRHGGRGRGRRNRRQRHGR